MKRATALFLLIFFHVSTIALSTDDVIWAQFDSPPSIILTGDNQGEGNVDLLMELFQRELSQNSHVEVVMNYNRFFKLAESNEKTVCAIGLNETPERIEMFYYSIPTTIELAPAIIIRKEQLKEFKGRKSIWLRELLSNYELNGAFVLGRSYFFEIDRLLEEFKNRKNIYVSTLIENQLLELLLRKRIDYFLHVPAVVNYLTLQQEEEKLFASIIIKDIPTFSMGYTVCNKTDLGKKVINQISKLLNTERATLEYLDILLKWQDNKSSKKMIEIYHKHLINQY